MRAWRLAGLSSALAFPLDLGARPLCTMLRGRGCANCLVTVTGSLWGLQLLTRGPDALHGLHQPAVDQCLGAMSPCDGGQPPSWPRDPGHGPHLGQAQATYSSWPSSPHPVLWRWPASHTLPSAWSVNSPSAMPTPLMPLDPGTTPKPWKGCWRPHTHQLVVPPTGT